MAATKEEGKELQILREAFVSIRRRAKALGIGDNDLTKSSSLKVLRSKKFSGLVLFGIILTALAVLIGAGTIMFRRKVVTHRMVYSFLADKVLDFDLEKESCFYPYPEIVLDMFRPPVNCSVCRDVHGVEKLSHLTQEVFSKKYAYTSRPVVITDGTKGWTAEKSFSFDYFKGVYGPNSPALDSQDSNCQFFPYKTNFRTLKEVFNMSKKDAEMKGKPWYIGWSNCDSSAANKLRQHYSRPYFLPENAESSKTDWIFMGCPGYPGAHLHIDQVGNPSWQAQIKGRKKWTLEPPPECASECNPKHEVIINPGEIIVLDTNRWFHQTDILPGDMSITIGSEYD